MTHGRFNSLTEEQQLFYTSKIGVYLSTRKDGMFSIDLYQATNFYIELFYKKGGPIFCLARAFTDTAHLDEYLKAINISDLLAG